MTLLAAALALLGLAGAMLARLGRAPDESRATALVRAALGAFAVLVVLSQALGTAGLATPLALLVGLAIACAAIAFVTTRLPPPAPRGTRPPWTAVEVGLAAAILAALTTRLSHGLHRTTFLYDTLSYHLHAPATWMRDGHLSIVPAVFGDGSPAYAPSNVELLFWLLMAPLRSDVLAQTGQLPLAALACAAVAASVREAGGPRAAALAAALAFLYVPEVWQQAPTAMVDLGMAAFFLASLPFLSRMRRAARAPDAVDVVTLGLALGLCAGTKVVGLAYALPVIALALPALVRSPRAALLALGAAATAGGTWYVRNLVVTGNPLYPMTVTLGRATIFAGLLDGADVRASAYHLPIGDVGALGQLLLDGGIAFALAGAVALARARQRSWPVLAAGLVALFWFVVPYQESRFLFPAFGVAAIAMGVPRDAATPWRWAPLALALAGSAVQFPTTARWAALAFGLIVTTFADRARARVAARWWVTVGAIALGAGAAELRGAIAAHSARDPHYDVGDDLATAWSWMRQNVRGNARVAYTGNNLPFPLWGRDLAGDVRYVNVAGAATDRLHDFARRVPRPREATPEPAPYRAGASVETWLANLRATNRDVLFVAALYPEVRRTIAHDADGFPVERAWADAHPARFRLLFASDAARVYALEAP